MQLKNVKFKNVKFQGVITALITPFYEGEVDRNSLIKLVQTQLSEGAEGFVISGTTGESPTLSEREVSDIASLVRSEVSGSIPLVLGIGHNSTRKALDNLRLAEKLKMDGALAVVPYYNKPSSEGLKKHFKKLAEASSLPIILYNVPSRTITQLEPELLLELSKEKNILGIKEASGEMEYLDRLRPLQRPDFSLLSGDDLSFLDFALKGGHGVISVASHFLMKPMKEALKEALSKNEKAVLKFKKTYGELLNLLYQTSNPTMIKQVMFFKGLIRSPELRLPLCPPPEHLCQKIKNSLEALSLSNSAASTRL